MKTIRQLKDQFQKRYSVDDLNHNEELRVLYQYLADQTRRSNGNFVHEPSDYICEMIVKYLDYDPRKTEKP